MRSLNLEKMGYSHIEQACLNELTSYEDDGIILESYTVLVPKAKTRYLFGTYNNSKFYYDYTSVSDMRRESNGAKKSASNAHKWDNWILGAVDLGMCFAETYWSIPYTIIRTITGVPDTSAVHYGSYNQYVEQFTKTVTRTVYKERTNNQLDPAYQDQTSSLRVKLYFCPVGTAFKSDYIDIGTVYTGSVSANNLTKEQIMKVANVYSNHKGEIIYRVADKHLREEWK